MCPTTPSVSVRVAVRSRLVALLIICATTRYDNFSVNRGSDFTMFNEDICMDNFEIHESLPKLFCRGTYAEVVAYARKPASISS